jgi:hypothetical protein
VLHFAEPFAHELTMNVFRSDIGDVKAPGDYPFRDGTLSVTAAEIAARQ